MTDNQIAAIAVKAGIPRSKISPLHRRLIVAAVDSTKPQPKKVKTSVRKTPNFEFFGVVE